MSDTLLLDDVIDASLMDGNTCLNKISTQVLCNLRTHFLLSLKQSWIYQAAELVTEVVNKHGVKRKAYAHHDVTMAIHGQAYIVPNKMLSLSFFSYF